MKAPLPGVYWLVATDRPECIAWAWFYVKGNGAVDVLALTGAASMLEERDADVRTARALYGRLLEQGWLKRSDAQAAAAGMTQARLRLLVRD